MPGKKKGGAAKKKGKKAKAAKAALERENVLAKVKALQRVYPTKCSGSMLPSGRILRDCRSAIEDERPVSQFILESSDIGRPVRPPSRSKPKSADKLSSKPTSVASVQPGTGPDKAMPPLSSTPSPVICLRNLMEAMLEVHYDYLRCLHVWNIPITDGDAVALALYMESSHGLNLKVLELRSNNLSPWSIRRLAGPIVRVGLHSLNLDYNRMSTATVIELCERIQQNIFLHTVSLNYCQIDPECGQSLGCMVAASQIRNLYLMGNRLQCQGIVDLVRPLVSLCEAEFTPGVTGGKLTDDHILSRTETTSPSDSVTEKQQRRQHSTKSIDLATEDMERDTMADQYGEMGVTRASPLIPSLARLDLRDNAIDYFGICKEERVKTFEPIIAMRAVKRLILASSVLEEINLDQNLIGDGGARELLHGLQQRREDSLPALKLIVTAIQISPETFQKIIELSSPPKKKKKRGTKKVCCSCGLGGCMVSV